METDSTNERRELQKNVYDFITNGNGIFKMKQFLQVNYYCVAFGSWVQTMICIVLVLG